MTGARRGGFTPIPHEERISEQQQQQKRRWTPSDFRNQVQQVLRQSATSEDKIQEIVRISPAFSDTTLVGGDYLDVPLRRHEEADSGQYMEYCSGYYGPEAVGLSPISSARAGVGLEFDSAQAAPCLASEGPHVDSNWHDISYRGPEGRTGEEVRHENRNFKPLSLKGKLLIIFFLSLASLVALAELAIQLLPNDAGINPFSQEYKHNTNVHPRFQFNYGAGALNYLAPFKRQNETGPPIIVPTTTETTSYTVPEPIPPPSSTSQITTIPPIEGGTTTDLSTKSTDLPTSSSVPVIVPPPVPLPLPSTSTVEIPSPPLSSSDSSPLPSTISSSKSISSPLSSLPLSSSPMPPGTSHTLIPSTTIVSSETQEPTRPHESSTGNQWPWPTSNHPGPDHSGQPPILDPPHTSYEVTSITPTLLPSSQPTIPDPDSPTNTRTAQPDSTMVVPTPPPPPLPPTSPSITKPSSSPTSISTVSPPFSTSRESSETIIKPPGTTSRLSASSSKAQSLSTTTMVQTTGESSGDSLTTPTIAPSSSLKSGSTSLKSSTADESTAFSSQSPSSTPSKFETLTSPPLSAMPEIFPTRTKQSTPPASETPETELPEPFTTITQIPDEPSPTKTTTITTLTSLSDVAFITTFVQGIKIGLDDQITKYVTTYTDFQGKPTRTESVLAQASMETTVYRDAHGVPTSTGTYIMLRPPRQTTLTDYQGRATLTQDYYLGLTTQVIYDVDGHPTTTATSMVTKIATLTTLFDEHGVPTLTKTELVPLSLTTTTIVTPTPEVAPNVQSKQAVKVVPISNGKYFLGLMLPTFIAIVVSISVRMIDQSARLYYPFHALASTRGALACDSLCFQTTDMWNLSARFRSLLSGDILLTLTGLLVLGSIILVPLTSEAVRIILKGPNCATSGGDSSACVMVLGVNPVQAQAVVALLVFLVIIVLITAIVLRRWETGLSWNPWSLFHMGHLAANNEIRTLLLRRVREKGGNVSNKDMNKTLAKKVFVLTNWEENGYSKYSILIRNETCLKTNGRPTRRKAHRRKTKGSSMPFFVLTWTGRLLFLALLCGMIIGLLIYTITGDGQDYIRYMNGRWRVVRVVFTTIGVFISLIWWSFFQSVAFLLPHKLLHRIRLYNGEAAYITPPTNPFTGVWSSLTPGRRDVYLGLVSATSILSEILPMLLSTSLDKCTESFWAHTVCLWMSVGVLSVMVFTITGFSFVDWPPSLPMDPSTIAGGMYYTLTNFISMSPSSGLLFGKESPGMV